MLLGTIKSLLRKQITENALPENADERFYLLIREKRYEDAEYLLAGDQDTGLAEPKRLALIGELRYHQQRHEEAERLCLDSARMDPSLAEPHYVLSLIYYDAGRFEDAVTHAQYARNRAPGNARILAQLGLCCIAIQNYGHAREVLRQAVLLDPENVPALNNLGIALHAMNEPSDALYYFSRALALKPDYGPTRDNLRTLFGVEAYASHYDIEANVIETRIEGMEALASALLAEDTRSIEQLEAEFESQPENVDAAVRLVEKLIKALNLEAARDVLNIALAHHPDAAPLLSLTGRIAHMLGRLQHARSYYEKALELEPTRIEALVGLGQVLRDLDMHEDALKPLQTAVAIEENPTTLTQLAFAQVNACLYEDALATCARVDEAYPNLSPFLNASRAVCHAYLGHFDKALEYLDQAQRIEATNPSFATFKGMIHLLHEEYAEGWEGYRYRILNDAQHMRLLPYPVWHGEDLTDKTILVLAEQGLGDQVMFASCLPDLLAMRPKQVVLEANVRVAKTLARSFPTIKVFSSGQQGFDWLPKELQPDFYVPIADLPRHFRRDKEAFPEHDGYLVADPERVAHWKARLDAVSDKPKIGFSWRGGVQTTRRAVRSLKLETMANLLSDPRFLFVNLQYGPVQEELASFSATHGLQVVDWPEGISDLDEFAALISALDLIITVCNTTVHFAGALGRPCWVLTPYIPEWRYGIDSPRMRWYPSTRMFRQATPNDWPGVLHEVGNALDVWSGGLRA